MKKMGLLILLKIGIEEYMEILYDRLLSIIDDLLEFFGDQTRFR